MQRRNGWLIAVLVVLCGIGIWQSPNPWRALMPFIVIALLVLGGYIWFNRRKRKSESHNPYHRKIVKQNKVREMRIHAKTARSKFRVIRGGKHEQHDPAKNGKQKYFH
jgi:hypothetical protein